MRRRERISTGNAFTLIEALVVVAVVAVLLAVALPVLRGARAQSVRAQTLSNTRQSAALLLTSAADNAGAIPSSNAAARFGMTGVAPVEIVTPTGVLGTDYFAQASVWPALLLARGYEPSPVWLSPARREEPRHPFQTDFDLTHAVLAGPEHWRSPETQRESMWRAVRLHEAAHAAKKALLVERASDLRRGEATTTPAVAFVDGHASFVLRNDSTTPVVNRFFHNAAIRLITTRDGLSGRDIDA